MLAGTWEFPNIRGTFWGVQHPIQGQPSECSSTGSPYGTEATNFPNKLIACRNIWACVGIAGSCFVIYTA